MKTIDGEEYLTLSDLADLWGLTYVQLRNLRYTSYGKTGVRDFPRQDRKSDSSRAHLWRYDRLPELNEWWMQIKDTLPGLAGTAVPVKEEAPKVEPTVVFQGVDIVLTVAENFPAFRDSHVLAVIKRHGEGTKTEHYFITREEAGYILSLFA